jgi:hypothetical protein
VQTRGVALGQWLLSQSLFSAQVSPIAPLVQVALFA